MDIRHDETIHESLRQTPHGPWPEDSLARVPLLGSTRTRPTT